MLGSLTFQLRNHKCPYTTQIIIMIIIVMIAINSLMLIKSGMEKEACSKASKAFNVFSKPSMNRK